MLDRSPVARVRTTGGLIDRSGRTTGENTSALTHCVTPNCAVRHDSSGTELCKLHLYNIRTIGVIEGTARICSAGYNKNLQLPQSAAQCSFPPHCFRSCFARCVDEIVGAWSPASTTRIARMSLRMDITAQYRTCLDL